MKQASATKKERLIADLMYLGQMASTEAALYHQRAATKNGVNITDSKAVSTLLQEGPMTAGQLATRLSLTTGAVTSVIDRLVSPGYIRRITDPLDRRKVILQVDSKSIEKQSQTYDAIADATKALLESYDAEQLEFLVGYQHKVIEMTQKEIARLAQTE